MPRNSAIPDGWEDYSPVGKPIEGTRFICFKVPLRTFINERVDEKDRLDIDGLLKAIPNLGLVIDLTDTFRYYNPQEFERKGVEYVKIRIQGKIVPQNDLVNVFKKRVHEFLRKNKNNDKLIGVHCTHGVNRTGFLICNYMISMMTLSPEDAIQKFNAARGHKMERENYLSALYDLNKEENYSRKRPTTSNIWNSDSNYRPKHVKSYNDPRTSDNTYYKHGKNPNSSFYERSRYISRDYRASDKRGFRGNNYDAFGSSKSYRPQNTAWNDQRLPPINNYPAGPRYTDYQNRGYKNYIDTRYRNDSHTFFK